MKKEQTDILVVGSGLAGSLFALELAKKRPDLQILVLNKKEKQQSSSFLAQGGIAAVLPGAADSSKQHLADTLEASAHSCNKMVAAYYVSKAAEAIHTLEHWGTAFDLQADGSKALALEGGHSTHRVLHHKDSTGKHILEKLHASLSRYKNITLREDVQVLELLQSYFTGAVRGAWGWDAAAKESVTIRARSVILATGGSGSLFAYSTNPATATGEGVYLAAKAGAEIKDLEYIQFHPTALWLPSGTQLPLISEAVRGAGAILRNEHGERFMEKQHPLKELAPRDIVARCIYHEIEKQSRPHVFLDATNLPPSEWNKHFPGILEICSRADINPSREWIPVVPAAHYSCGGIATSVKGETTVKNLYVIGETACTGLHGANRLASNSLLEATVMASSLASGLAQQELPDFEAVHASNQLLFHDPHLDATASSILAKIREILQEGCGIVKTNHSLQEAQHLLLDLKLRLSAELPADSLQHHQLKMSLQVALMLTKASIEQTENKGVFFNKDLKKELVSVVVRA